MAGLDPAISEARRDRRVEPGDDEREEKTGSKPRLIGAAGDDGAEAAAEDGVKRVAAAGRGQIEAAYVAPVASFGKKAGDEAEMAGVVEQAPAADRRRRRAAAGKRDDQRSVRLDDPPDLPQHFERPRQVLHRGADRGAVKLDRKSVV